MKPMLRDKVWKYRYNLMKYPEALPVFIRAIDWTSADDVTEAQQLLNSWTPPSVTDALQLLGSEYWRCKKYVRSRFNV